MKNDNIDEKVQNWYKEHSEKLKSDHDKMEKLISNTDYIDWLSNFLRDKKYISDYDWMYFPDLFNENERMNIAKICLLYQLVNEYSIKNSISVNDCEYGNYYGVKYKSFSFDIGVKLDKEIMFFCSQNIYDDNYIDFNNILKKKEKILIKK